ncbi:g5153 [Coccomyxa elongata]
MSGDVSLAPVLRGEPFKGVDHGSEKLREASNRIVQVVTQVEGRASTAVPLGTGALKWKDVIVTARHTVVDRDGEYVDAFVDGRRVEFLIANPAADLALLKLPEPVKTVNPFYVATSTMLERGKPVAVLGYPQEVENSMHSELMQLQGHIVGIDHSGYRAFCPRFEGFSEASGAAVLYEYDLLAGIHIETMNHPNAADRPLTIPPLAHPVLFEKDKEKLWAASKEAFDVAKAKSIEESYNTKYPGEHAIIVPAHHIYALMRGAGHIHSGSLSRYPVHVAKG